MSGGYGSSSPSSVTHSTPDFNRVDLKAMLPGEMEIQEGRTYSSEEVTTAFGFTETSRRDDE